MTLSAQEERAISALARTPRSARELYGPERLQDMLKGGRRVLLNAKGQRVDYVLVFEVPSEVRRGCAAPEENWRAAL